MSVVYKRDNGSTAEPEVGVIIAGGDAKIEHATRCQCHAITCEHDIIKGCRRSFRIIHHNS
jgi:hypothetical protein